MAKTTKTYEPVKTGADPRGTSNNNGEDRIEWLKIEPNSVVDVVALVDVNEIISCEQCAIWRDEGNSPVWVYTGADDPCHDLNLDRRYRAYLPVIPIHNGVLDENPQVWSMGKGAHIALLDIADATGSLKGLEIRIKRTGKGLATRYSINGRGKKHNVKSYDEVDVVSMLGPTDPDEVKEMIATKLGFDNYNDVLSGYAGKAKKAVQEQPSTRQPAKAKAKVKEVEEEVEEDIAEEIEDLELL